MSLPFAGEEFTFTNPDGSTIRVRGWGNDFYAVFETLDGFTVVKDASSGYYHYAQLSSDQGDLLSTGVKVGDVDPHTLGLPQHLRIRPDATIHGLLERLPPGRWHREQRTWPEGLRRAGLPEG